MFHPVILRFDSLGSTNAEALEQARRGAPEGVCVVAREQTAGRGRHGRAWSSPPEAGLYFSLALRPKFDLSAWSLIPLAASIAVREALMILTHVYGGDEERFDIKWSNDVLYDERKICGILAETTETETGRACIVGIGINISRDVYPRALENFAISLEDITGLRIDSEFVLRELILCLQKIYVRLNEPEGGRQIVREYESASSYARGKLVRVHGVNETFEGVTRGIEPDGALRVETASGAIKVVRAADVERLRRR